MLYIYPSKCSGCHTCELVCSLKNEGLARPSMARIQVIADKHRGTRVPMAYRQCEDPICRRVCPMGALSKDSDSGVVKHDKQKCIGCKSCIAACPFGGTNFNVDSRRIFKCEQCDGRPQCVRFCVDQAITYIDAATVAAKRKREAAVDPTTLPVIEGGGAAH